MSRRSKSQGECIHGLRYCAACREPLTWGKLKTRQYQEAIADMFPLEDDLPPTVQRNCEHCPRRHAGKGNRINVRLPRPRVSFAKGAPVYPPSWSGEVVTRPKVRPATHRRKGKWLCDKCDPDHAVGIAAGSGEILTEADLFG